MGVFWSNILIIILEEFGSGEKGNVICSSSCRSSVLTSSLQLVY